MKPFYKITSGGEARMYGQEAVQYLLDKGQIKDAAHLVESIIQTGLLSKTSPVFGLQENIGCVLAFLHGETSLDLPQKQYSEFLELQVHHDIDGLIEFCDRMKAEHNEPRNQWLFNAVQKHYERYKSLLEASYIQNTDIFTDVVLDYPEFCTYFWTRDPESYSVADIREILSANPDYTPTDVEEQAEMMLVQLESLRDLPTILRFLDDPSTSDLYAVKKGERLLSSALKVVSLQFAVGRVPTVWTDGSHLSDVPVSFQRNATQLIRSGNWKVLSRLADDAYPQVSQTSSKQMLLTVSIAARTLSTYYTSMLSELTDRSTTDTRYAGQSALNAINRYFVTGCKLASDQQFERRLRKTDPLTAVGIVQYSGV